MEAIIQEIDVERLLPIFNIPLEIRNRRVEVTIKPIDLSAQAGSKPQATATDRIRQFREKYNRQSFIEHLKTQVANGHSFSFDAQRIIDGTETEAEEQERYRLEKQSWGNAIKEKAQEEQLA